MNFDITKWKEDILNYLQQKDANKQYDDLEEIIKVYNELSLKIPEILENATKNSSGETKEKLTKLYEKFFYGPILNYLQEKVKNNQYDGFEDIIEEYKNLAFDIQKILEYAAKYSSGKTKDELIKLYERFSYDYAGEMVERLRRLGYALRSDKNVKDAFSDQAFRIMEKVRHSQRSEVQYLITRIFVANKKEVPNLLAKAFNPVYSNELFKTFIYSFLSGILGETKEGGEE